MRCLIIALSIVGAAGPAAAAAPAASGHPRETVQSIKPTPKRHRIEVGVFGGYTRMVSNIDYSHEVSAFNGGGAIAGSIVYNSPYFLSPFIDVGYYPLYRSLDVFDVGSAGGKIGAASALSAIGFLLGPALDIRRFRVKYGIGIYNLRVTTTVLGVTSTPDEIDFGYMFAFSGFFLKRPRIQIGAELRTGIIVEADKAFVSLGLTIAGKPIAW